MIEENIKRSKKEEEKKTQTKRTRTRKENKTEKKGTQPTEEKGTRKPYQRRNTNKIMKQEKNEKSSKHRLCPRYDQQIYQCDEEAGESHTGKSTTCCPRAPNAVDPLGQNKNPPCQA